MNGKSFPKRERGGSNLASTTRLSSPKSGSASVVSAVLALELDFGKPSPDIRKPMPELVEGRGGATDRGNSPQYADSGEFGEGGNP